MKSSMWIAVVLAGAAIAGCKSKPKEEAKNDDFLPDDANRTVWRTLEKQSAAGAAEDGNLYAYHFDGAELSDLGRDKLDLMSRSDMRPLMVYLDADDEAQLTARTDAVTRFLESAGIAADELKVERGPNPSATSAAAPNLARMSKTESPGRDGDGDIDSDQDLDSSGVSP